MQAAASTTRHDASDSDAAGPSGARAPQPTRAPSGPGSGRLVWLHCLVVACTTGIDRVARGQHAFDYAAHAPTADDGTAVAALLLDRRIVLVRGWHVTSFTSGSIAAFLPIADVSTPCAVCTPGSMLYIHVLCIAVAVVSHCTDHTNSGGGHCE